VAILMFPIHLSDHDSIDKDQIFARLNPAIVNKLDSSDLSKLRVLILKPIDWWSDDDLITIGQISSKMKGLALFV